MTTIRARARVSRRRLVAAGVVVIVAVVAAIWWATHRDSSADHVPYGDSAAVGVVGLCDSSGKAITSGSTKAAPFVWRAVGSSAASAAYAGAGRTATLYAFQPRPGVDAPGWSGQQLTSSGRYTNVAHPMAQATGKDMDLNDFLIAYPPLISGFVELRLYLGAPNQPLLTTKYDATDIKVSGSSWRVVGGGGPVSCTDGKSVSLETLLDPSAAPSR
jgi:hypothetical protein